MELTDQVEKHGDGVYQNCDNGDVVKVALGWAFFVERGGVGGDNTSGDWQPLLPPPVLRMADNLWQDGDWMGKPPAPGTRLIVKIKAGLLHAAATSLQYLFWIDASGKDFSTLNSRNIQNIEAVFVDPRQLPTLEEEADA